MEPESQTRNTCSDCDFALHFEPIAGATVFPYNYSHLHSLCMHRSIPCGRERATQWPRQGNNSVGEPYRRVAWSGNGGVHCFSTGLYHPRLFAYKMAERRLVLPFYAADIVSAYQELRPRAHIAAAVADMSRRWQLREFGVGVHVRRTDRSVQNVKHGDDERQLHEMAAALEREPRTVFYLATDNADSQRQFENAFPGRVHYYEQLEEHPDQFRKSNTTVAIIDLFTLAECRELVRSSVSSFGQMADGLQCARSNGKLGRWCSWQKPGSHLGKLNSTWDAAYEAYERALEHVGDEWYQAPALHKMFT